MDEFSISELEITLKVIASRRARVFHIGRGMVRDQKGMTALWESGTLEELWVLDELRSDILNEIERRNEK
jgi:hypothetical protein